MLNIAPDTLDFGEVSVGWPVTLEFTLESVNPDNFLTVTLFLDDTTHFHLRWTGPRAEARSVMSAIGDIRDACRMYWIDFGEYPTSVVELIELGYVRIPDAVARNWHFDLIGQSPISQIEAVSTDQMPDGAGHLIIYDLQTGRFDGYGTPWGDPIEPRRVQETLGALHNAARLFRQDFGSDPVSVEVLIELEYIYIPIDLLRKWIFVLVGNPLRLVEAQSTAEFIDGAGRIMVLNIQSGEFSGYGIPYPEFRDWLWGDISSQTLSVQFSPDDAGDYSSQITILLDRNHRRNDTLSIPVRARGTLAVSANHAPTPIHFEIADIYPNPFNGALTIRYDLPAGAQIRLTLYDLSGREVALMDEGWSTAGRHVLTWDGAALAGGVYFVRLQANGLERKTKVVALK